jgi:hypothetical protein
LINPIVPPGRVTRTSSSKVLLVKRGDGPTGEPARMAKMAKHYADAGWGRYVHATTRRGP